MNIIAIMCIICNNVFKCNNSVLYEIMCIKYSKTILPTFQVPKRDHQSDTSLSCFHHPQAFSNSAQYESISQSQAEGGAGIRRRVAGLPGLFLR